MLEDLYGKNYKTPIKETYLCLWVGRFNITKMSILPKLPYSFNTFLVKSPARFFYRYVDKNILKYKWKGKGTRICKTILKEKNTVGEITLPNFKTYTATGIKIVWYW